VLDSSSSSSSSSEEEDGLKDEEDEFTRDIDEGLEHYRQLRQEEVARHPKPGWFGGKVWVVVQACWGHPSAEFSVCPLGCGTRKKITIPLTLTLTISVGVC